jgi:hypothetical protein
METIIQTEMKREDYYEGTIMDIRNLFINYGHWLEKKGIENEGSIEDYENYLHNIEQQKLEESKETHLNNSIPTRNDDLIEFQCWLAYQNEWDNEIIIIKKEEWDRFFESKIEDDEMDMKIVQADDFYEEFEKLVGIYDFDECFVRMNYIDEVQNLISLTININGKDESFMIDIA